MPQVVILHEEHKRHVRKIVMVVAAVCVAAVVVLAIAVNLVWAGQHSEALKNAKDMDSKGQYASEIQYLQHYLATLPPKQYQYDALVAEGKAAEKSGQYHVAFESYLSADTMSSKPNLDLKLDVARAATAIGDKSTAISYYKQAIGLTPKSDDEQIGSYQDEIRGLQH